VLEAAESVDVDYVLAVLESARLLAKPMDYLIDGLVVGFLRMDVSVGLELLIQDVPAMTTLLQTMRERYRLVESAHNSHRMLYSTALKH
jgi:hypothetical protein